MIEKILKEENRMNITWQDMELILANPMFRLVEEKINNEDPQLLYVVFDMGSVILNTGDPMNHIKIYDGFIEIFNSTSGETTFIKTRKVGGFVFEPPQREFEEGVLSDVGDLE